MSKRHGLDAGLQGLQTSSGLKGGMAAASIRILATRHPLATTVPQPQGKRITSGIPGRPACVPSCSWFEGLGRLISDVYKFSGF